MVSFANERPEKAGRRTQGGVAHPRHIDGHFCASRLAPDSNPARSRVRY